MPLRFRPPCAKAIDCTLHHTTPILQIKQTSCQPRILPPLEDSPSAPWRAKGISAIPLLSGCHARHDLRTVEPGAAFMAYPVRTDRLLLPGWKDGCRRRPGATLPADLPPAPRTDGHHPQLLSISRPRGLFFRRDHRGDQQGREGRFPPSAPAYILPRPSPILPAGRRTSFPAISSQVPVTTSPCRFWNWVLLPLSFPSQAA